MGTVDMDMSLVCFVFVLRMDLKEASASLYGHRGHGYVACLFSFCSPHGS